ncbi:uncharacterized protein [Argopecten irradians]|uniref:uncharacterized protein n=1 Tax=Argopecten irradians TaxID=31199 RepID=UPI003715E268
MKYNLIFSGIVESPWDANGHGEDSGKVVKTFIRDKLEMEDADDIQMANVHRIGKRDRSTGATPRPIIVKFVFFKDLTKVKMSTRKLASFWVNEQFPKEIEEKRKDLYPEAKNARKAWKKVAFVRDKLYINNQLFEPTSKERENEDTPLRPPRTKRRCICSDKTGDERR